MHLVPRAADLDELFGWHRLGLLLLSNDGLSIASRVFGFSGGTSTKVGLMLLALGVREVGALTASRIASWISKRRCESRLARSALGMQSKAQTTFNTSQVIS